MVEAFEGLQRERDWFAEGAVEGNPIVLLVGPEKSHKSWTAMALAVATVLGESWLGHFRVRRRSPAATIAYADGEYGAHETARRLARIARGYGASPLDVLRRVRHLHDLRLQLDGSALIGASERDKERRSGATLMKLLHDVDQNPPELVVIDPLRNFLIGSENDADAIVNAWVALEAIRRTAGCPVLVLHHLNRAGNFSGSRALLGRADLIIEGSDEPEPWYASRGRTIRRGDRIAERFTLAVEHEHDDDDTVAATRVQARFAGETGGSLSSLAKAVLDQLMLTPKGATTRTLRTSVRRSHKDVARALDELSDRALVDQESNRWRPSLSALTGGGK